MNLVRGTSHTKEYDFTDEELYTLRPAEIARYLGILAYGKEEPDLQNDNPTNGRSSSLQFAKKALSYYMPNRSMTWNNQTEQGNPTKSTLLNDFIKVVKKKEVRKEGKSSQAKRALHVSEYQQLIRKIREGDLSKKYALAAYFIFQFHMIARVDDVMHFKQEDLTPNLEFDFTLKSKMSWSKNILSEDRTSDQIVMGAGNTDFCTILALAVHLEHGIGNGELEEGGALMGISKAIATNAFKKIVNGEDFTTAPLDGLLGSHSTRKFASTYARRNGCSRDDVDLRGRWKGDKRTVDLYIDDILPYPDAKVAGALCVGGPIKYELKRGSNVSDAFILQYVCPHIASFFPSQMALVFGKALLWGIFDEQFSIGLEAQLVENVRAVVNNITNDLEMDENPVKKVPLMVSGEEATLVLNEIIDDDDNDNGGGGGGNNGSNAVGSDQCIRGQMQLVLSTVRMLSRQNEEMKSDLQVFKITCNTLLEQLNENVKRVSLIPGARHARTRGGGGVARIEPPEVDSATNRGNTRRAPPQYQSTLMKNPKSLYVLWQEYEFGIGGRKPARQFSSKERGGVKFCYSLRNHYWKLVDKMILRGYTHTAAIDKIYSVYGSKLSTTKILQKIRSDSKTGGHNLLN